jgi:hypothetical protein
MRLSPTVVVGIAVLSIAASPVPTPVASPSNYYYSGNWYYSLPPRSQKQQKSNPHQPMAETRPSSMPVPLANEKQAATNQPSNSPQKPCTIWLWIMVRLWEFNWSNWALVAAAVWAGRAAYGSWQEMRTQTQANAESADKTLKLTQEVAHAATENAKATTSEIEFLLQTERPYLFVSNIAFTSGEFLAYTQTTPARASVATLRGTPAVNIGV